MNWTALFYAAEDNSKDIGEFLITKGININEKDINDLNV